MVAKNKIPPVSPALCFVSVGGGDGRGFNKEMIVYHEEKKKTSRNCHLFSFTYSA
jgi:hypothetical protein